MDWKQVTDLRAHSALLVLGFVLVAGASFAEEDEKEGWAGVIAASVNAQTGSTDTLAAALDASTERTFDEKDRLRGRFSGSYGTTRSRDNDVNTETIANQQTLSGDWTHTFSERFFWLTTPSIARDSTQDLEVRAMLSTGPGYRVWQGEAPKKKHFDLSAGPGYRFEMYDGNTGGPVSDNGDSDHFVDIVAGFEYKNLLFDDKVVYSHTGSVRMPGNDVSSYLLESEVVISVPITAAWSFRTGFLVQYVAEPSSDEVNNTTTRTNVGLEYKF